MKSGRLKKLLANNNIESISVIIVRMNQMITTKAVDLKFITKTRKDFLLDITRNPKPRENKTKLMQSFLASFKDTHTIFAHDIDKEEVYKISDDYTIDKKELQLTAERI